jgi:hypothetical protein
MAEAISKTTVAASADIASRRQRLAACDAALAKRLRTVWAVQRPTEAAPEPDAAVHHRVAAWLKRGQADLIVVPGLGDGNAVAALIDTLPEKASLLIVERDPARLDRLFSRRPVETLIESRRLQIKDGEDEIALASAMGDLIEIDRNPHIRLFDLTKPPPDDARLYASALLKARYAMQLSAMNLSTLIASGPHVQYNTFKNLPITSRQPGAKLLRKAFPGRPAVVAAAGPSLSEAIPHLKRCRASVFLIAVGTTLKPLLAAGLAPDLVVSVDASPWTGVQCSLDCSDLYLVAALMAYPPVLRKFKGVFMTTGDGNNTGAWAEPHLAGIGDLSTYGTVTLTALDAAVQMGCDPIATVGLDLCLGADGTAHARNTVYYGRIAEESRDTFAVPGNVRETVTTHANLRCYIDIISDYVTHRLDHRFINVNSDGARIAGMEFVGPAWLDRWVGSKPFNARGKIEAIYRAWNPPRPPPLTTALQRAQSALTDFADHATRAAMLCNRIMALLKMPGAGDTARVQEWLDQMRDIDTTLSANADAQMLTALCMRGVSFAMRSERQAHEKRYSEGLLANRRSRRLYEALAQTARTTRRLVDETLAAIESGAEPDLTKFKDSPMAQDLHVQ